MCLSTEMTTCCTCQKAIRLLVSALMSAAGVSSAVTESVNMLSETSCFYFTDPQHEAKVASDKLGAHTDWLTLNIGGRPFTTTRYLRS